MTAPLLRRFGRGRPVTPFTLGTMRALDSPATMAAVLDAAIVAGIRHVETAPAYGPAEAFLGEALQGLEQRDPARRRELVLTSKLLPGCSLEQGQGQLRTLLDRLAIPRLDNLAVHGLNTPEHLDWALQGEGRALLAWAEDEGLVGQVGFSSHGPTPLIEQALASGRFGFCSLHLHLFDPERLPLARAALDQGIGVMAISPADKGGRLYDPPPELLADCAPFHPLELAYRLLLDEGISTLTVGAAQPGDLAWAAALCGGSDRNGECGRSSPEAAGPPPVPAASGLPSAAAAATASPTAPSSSASAEIAVPAEASPPASGGRLAGPGAASTAAATGSPAAAGPQASGRTPHGSLVSPPAPRAAAAPSAAADPSVSRLAVGSSPGGPDDARPGVSAEQIPNPAAGWALEAPGPGASGVGDPPLALAAAAASSPAGSWLSPAHRAALARLEAAGDERLAESRCGQCRQCLPCPKDVPIPALLRLRNLAVGHGMVPFASERYSLIGRAGHWWEQVDASACQRCGDCLPRCPLQLPIPALLADTHRLLAAAPRRRLWG